MKMKVSVTLSSELIEAIDRHSVMGESRSASFERASWERIRRLEREARDAHDAAIYARYADELNAEALDTLGFQSDDW